jgi:hypothetical protein
MARATVDARGIRVFAKEMRRAAPKLGVAASAALRAIGNEVRDEVRSSTESPYAENPAADSQGKVGRKRRSVKTSVRAGGVSLYSLEPDAGVWEWGGKISPRGVPITIPRTNFVRGAIEAHKEKTEAALLGIVDEVARRYAEFT